MPNSAVKSASYEQQVNAATERMARILGASFERNDRKLDYRADDRKAAQG